MGETTRDSSQREPAGVPEPLLYVVVLSLSAFLLFFNLGANSMHASDEAGHALVAREMLEGGDWLTLRYEGQPYLKKGPLKFWLTALTYRLLGINEWTARLWSALFASATVLALCTLGDIVFGRRVGLLAALVLVTSHQFLFKHCARTGEQDSALLFFWTLAMLLLLVALENRQRSVLCYSFASVGLCGLVKHLALIPEILLIVAVFLLITGRWRLFPARTWLLVFSIPLLIVLPWTLHQLWLHGTDFFAIHFGREIVTRVQGGLPGTPDSPLGLWFYPVTIKNGLFPWSLLLPFAVFQGLLQEGAETRRRNLLLLVWIGIVVLVPLFSVGKAFRYVLPAYPAIALLVGQLLNRLTRRADDRLALASAGIALLVAAVSTTNTRQHNPFAARRGQEMLSADILGRLESGTLESWTWPLILGLAVAVWLVWRYRAASGVRWAILALYSGLALSQVAYPLRWSDSKTPIHKLVLEAEESRPPSGIVWTALPPRQANPTRNRFYLRQLEPGVEHLRPHSRALANRVRREGEPILLLTTPKLALAFENEPWVARRVSVETLAHEGGLALVRATPKKRRRRA